jgi:hypothetical protein
MKKIDQISTYNQHHLLISFLRNINRRKDEQAVCTLVRTQTIGRSSQYIFRNYDDHSCPHLLLSQQ